MLSLTEPQLNLLHLLKDGACHSGNELGQALGISRSAIWKQINQLIDFGIPVTRLAHQGYQLPSPLILLDHQLISNQLQAIDFKSALNLHVLTSVDSTNRFLKELPPSQMLDVCCAELQTQGRGRFGRQWHSPFGENIYCSSRWSLNCDLGKLSGLSLVTSLAVLSTLNEFTTEPDIKIKWPNDILWRDKKLCGSLIEIIAESNGTAQIIIGIGINVNSDTENQPLLDKPWCSLYEITQQKYNRNLILASLIANLDRYLKKFMAHDLSVFMSEWNKSDYLVGKKITVAQSGHSLSGIARGITQAGLLILKDEDGLNHFLSSGDTTLNLGNR
ncbi:biotin--[acetyl-CoA-carboxylase] ligase [Legionella shakespearei]|uniref:Bifunctional ligase/repressor BirA n=1 Tax=Legionella shakespearei DSM 23087 TaxID=1122169 RepID=A0A0W0YV35_9GAMM|nr:biotin--[acetyl-CoA-carboxylase] ligase [Legionella shakespearei]KTD60745.1 biotin-[acetylCoA carboxylase] holoenzyme synthetase and biotin operon repressor [Legionella shakespearei DSM 23087]